MKEVRKKSADAAVNQMLLNAYRRQISLSWDRSENMQPQCGFGKLSICCSDCHEGPCRINPFGTDDQQTVCGSDKHDLTDRYVLNKVRDGVAAFLKLEAEFGGTPNAQAIMTAMSVDDEMLLPQDYAARLVSLGQKAVDVLKNIRGLKVKIYGECQPDVTESNLGVLKSEAINVVLHGHIAPAIVAELTESARSADTAINFVALCGSELGGGNMPVLTNYGSQETPLLTGAVDLLILGSQCVMPAMVKLAKQLKIEVYHACDISGSEGLANAINAAKKAFLARKGKPVNIPAVKNDVYAGYIADNIREWLAALTQDKVQGLVYLGGCGNIAGTQDADFIKLAQALITQGYLIVSAGCAGTALAKAGFCQPDYNNGMYPLHGILPAGIPPVLYLGSCHDAGEFLTMTQVVGKLPVTAIFPALAHNKVLATAVGFAATGINTWLGLDSAFNDSVTAGHFGGELFARGGASVLPLSGLGEISRNLAEAAGGK